MKLSKFQKLARLSALSAVLALSGCANIHMQTHLENRTFGGEHKESLETMATLKFYKEYEALGGRFQYGYYHRSNLTNGIPFNQRDDFDSEDGLFIGYHTILWEGKILQGF